ncbi:hypothetical protein FRC01_003454 [Tulasnella sp. 417]|nr:hypothetical protein FRC01_003454 [Tulasnella sp. 417]
MESTTESASGTIVTEDERRCHNDELAIHHLPPELLCNVFQDARKKENYRSLFVIRSVCKYWMEIIDSSGELWTFVSLMHNRDLLDMILQKSKNHLLSIEYDDGTCSGKSKVPSEQIAHFLGHIVPLVDRWKALEYQVSPYADHDRVLGLPFKNLETLGARTHMMASTYIEPLHAPKLRTVDLVGFSVDWGRLSELRVLMLSGPTFRSLVSEVYLLFNTCPELEILKIRGGPTPPTSYGMDNLPSAPVFLPHLQYLLLFMVPIVPYSHLISLIDAPNLRRLLIYRWFNPRRLTDPMFEPLERLFGSYSRSVTNGCDDSRLRICGPSSSFTVWVGACKMVLQSPSVWMWKGSRLNCLAELSAALSKFDTRVCEAIKAIRFSGTRSREDLIAIGPILQRHFPNVVELVATLSSLECRPDADRVLEALASPLASEDGARWLFPGLTTLHLKGCREAVCDGVLGVIEARGNGGVQAIQRVSIRNGRIGRDTVARLKV